VAPRRWLSVRRSRPLAADAGAIAAVLAQELIERILQQRLRRVVLALRRVFRWTEYQSDPHLPQSDPYSPYFSQHSSKFIEQHKGVLAGLLDLALPAESIDTGTSGAGAFERRYGFRGKPTTIRFRLLDLAKALPPDLTA
jgi:hypothetical protein